MLLFINGLVYGSPKTDPYVGEVVKDSPAYVAGLEDGDLILKVNNKKVRSWDDIILETHFGNSEDSFTFLIEVLQLHLNIKKMKMEKKFQVLVLLQILKKTKVLYRL